MVLSRKKALPTARFLIVSGELKLSLNWSKLKLKIANKLA